MYTPTYYSILINFGQLLTCVPQRYRIRFSVHHDVVCVVVKHCRHVVAWKCIGTPTNEQARLPHCAITYYNYFYVLHFETMTWYSCYPLHAIFYTGSYSKNRIQLQFTSGQELFLVTIHSCIMHASHNPGAGTQTSVDIF